MKEIRITIDKNNKITIDFTGFEGSECFRERERIVELLKKYGVNVDIQFEEKKPEAYVDNQQHEHVLEVW